MKNYFLLVLIASGFSAQARLIEPEGSRSCKVGNGWELKLDWYYDGHPQGPGGWSAIGQIDDWGKFPVQIRSWPEEIGYAISRGPNRLEDIELELSIMKGWLKTRSRLPLGNYSEWETYDLSCK